MRKFDALKFAVLTLLCPKKAHEKKLEKNLFLPVTPPLAPSRKMKFCDFFLPSLPLLSHGSSCIFFFFQEEKNQPGCGIFFFLRPPVQVAHAQPAEKEQEQTLFNDLRQGIAMGKKLD